MGQQVLEFSKHMRKMEYKERVIVANIKNGQWMKVSKQCYDILQESCRNQLEEQDFIERFVELDDRRYMNELVQKLKTLGVMKEKESNRFQNMQIDFAITHRCNLACTHCCVDADSMKGKEHLSTEECKEILDSIIAANPKRITLTGGEPLVRSDFKELLEYITEHYNGEIGLMTNGVLINEQNVDLLMQHLYSIDISIDGVDEETCSKIRGKGVFGKVVNSIKLLKSRGYNNISLSMVVTQETAKYEERFDQLNEELGTVGMKRVFSPVGRGEKNKESLMVEESNVEDLSDENAKEIDLNAYTVYHCGALEKTIYINYKGSIFPCGLLEKDEYAIGNIKDIVDFKEFIEEEQYCKCKGYNKFESIMPDKFERCANCEVNLFCWSCLHFIDMVKDEKLTINHRCKERKNDLMKIIWKN